MGAPFAAAHVGLLAAATLLLTLGLAAPAGADEPVDGSVSWDQQGAGNQPPGEDCTAWHFVLTAGGADIHSATLSVQFESGASVPDSGSQAGGGSWHFFLTSTGDRVASATATFTASREANTQLVLSDADCAEPEPEPEAAAEPEPDPEPEPEAEPEEAPAEPEPEAEPEEAPAEPQPDAVEAAQADAPTEPQPTVAADDDVEAAGQIGERSEEDVADVRPEPDAAAEQVGTAAVEADDAPPAALAPSDVAPAAPSTADLAVTGGPLLALLLAGLGLAGVGGVLVRRRGRLPRPPG